MTDPAGSNKEQLCGFLDTATPRKISGWAALRGSDVTLHVELSVDGELLTVVECKEFRRGVLQTGAHPTGQCGFSLSLPQNSKLSAGQEISAIVVDSGFELTHSPRLVTDDSPVQGAEEKKLFFMHIAKTAGSSLNAFIAEHYPPSRVHIHLENSDFRSAEDFSSGYDFLSGHVRAVEARRRLDLTDFFRVTLLRDPVSHLASHLCWVRHVADNPNSAFFHRHPEPIKQIALKLHEVDLAKPESIEDFLSQESLAITNLFHDCQTRYFLRPGDHGKKLDETHLAIAMKNLGWFHLVGTTERFSEFTERLCEQFGWDLPLEGERKNVNQNRYGLDLNDPDTRSVLAHYTQTDQQLYDAAIGRAA